MASDICTLSTYAMRQLNLRSTENYLRYLLLAWFAYVAWESMQLCSFHSKHIEYQNISTLVAPQSLNLHIQLHQIEHSKRIESKIHKTKSPRKLYKLTERYWNRATQTEIASNAVERKKIHNGSDTIGVHERKHTHVQVSWANKAHSSTYLKF